MKIARVFLIAGLLTVFLAGIACAYVYPTATLDSYDPGTFLYTYKVVVTPQDSFSFGYLQLDTLVMNSGAYGGWIMHGPVVGSMDLAWTTDTFVYDMIYDPVIGGFRDSAVWYADPSKGQDPVAPSDWVGYFTLIAPNTQPDWNAGMTMYLGFDDQNAFHIEVPAPAPFVPEPSSMVAMAGGLVGLAGSLIRRRRI